MTILSWNDTTKNLDPYVTGSDCVVDPDRSAFNEGCTVLGQSTEPFGTREEVVSIASSGESYRAWLVNYASTAAPFDLEFSLK